jgi:hypothetical protein
VNTLHEEDRTMTTATTELQAWIDLTVRPTGEPEVELTPAGEIEVSWDLETAGSRVTVLVARDAAEALISRLRELLGAVTAVALLVLS